jgi:hypothetical protein
MGCFLGCFGSSKDGKRRKHRHNKVQPRNQQRIASCTPAQSTVSSTQGASETPINIPVSQVRDEPEKELSFRGRKKVTFNSNVETYEHVSCEEVTDFVPESEGGDVKEGEEENIAKPSQTKSSSEDSSITSSSGSYPPNHRYQNCRDSDDEYEEVDYDESDLDDDEDDGGLGVNDFYEEDDDDGIVESRRRISVAHVVTEEVDCPMPICDKGEVKPVAYNPNARDRSAYVHPVLNPVENLTQWKAVKAKGTPLLRPQKENFVSNQEEVSFSSEPCFMEPSFSFKSKTDQSKKSNQEVAVDASLSNWLVSSEATPINKSSTIGPNTITTENSMSGRSNSSRKSPSPDDRPILGALTLEELKQFSASSSPRRSPSPSPDDMPIIGTVGTYWSHTGRAKDYGSASSFKGIPNTTSKYREVYVYVK